MEKIILNAIGLDVDVCKDRNKFKIDFLGDGKSACNCASIVFNYDDLMFVRCDKRILRLLMPYLVIFNHMLEENGIDINKENENENNNDESEDF